MADGGDQLVLHPLGPLVFGHVAHRQHEMGAVGKVHQAERNIDRHLAAIGMMGAAVGKEGLRQAPMGHAHAVQKASAIFPAGIDDQRQVFAHEIVRIAAEQATGRRIHHLNASAGVENDQRVMCAVEDRPVPLRALDRLDQRGIALPTRPVEQPQAADQKRDDRRDDQKDDHCQPFALIPECAALGLQNASLVLGQRCRHASHRRHGSPARPFAHHIQRCVRPPRIAQRDRAVHLGEFSLGKLLKPRPAIAQGHVGCILDDRRAFGEEGGLGRLVKAEIAPIPGQQVIALRRLGIREAGQQVGRQHPSVA